MFRSFQVISHFPDLKMRFSYSNVSHFPDYFAFFKKFLSFARISQIPVSQTLDPVFRYFDFL